MNNAPTYTRTEFLEKLALCEERAPASFTRAIAALGVEAKAVFTCGGPCLPSSVAIATGRNLSGVAADMNGAGFQHGDVLDGVYLDRVREALASSTRAFSPCPEFHGQTLAAAAATGRTFVAIVAGGHHAVTIKGGDLYDTAGKSMRCRIKKIYEIFA